MTSIAWKSGISGTWSNAGNWSPGQVPGAGDDVTIAMPGSYTVTGTVPFAAHSIVINDAGATLSDTSTLTLGTVLTLTAGTFNLGGATLSGGTIAVAGGTFLFSGGTLSNVTYQGTLGLTAASAALTVVGGLTVTPSGGGSGTVNVTGTAANLGFVGTQTFNNATVNFGSTSESSEARLTEKDVPQTGATLTLGASLDVLGNGGYGLLQATDTAANDALVNAGTISFGSSGGLIEVTANRFTNTGSLVVSHGGTLDLLTGPLFYAAGEVGSNSGSITLSSGSLSFGSTFTNTGSVVASGGTVSITGNFVTTGTFQANNTKLNIGGTISGGSLLALLNNTSDTVSYSAVYNNTGAVLNVGSGTAIGTLSLTSSLPILNGTIADAGGGFIFNSGTLTNVTYQGTIDLSRNNAYLNIATNLISQRTGGGGPGSVKLTGTTAQMSFLGTQTFDNATVTIGSSVSSAFARLQERDNPGTGATLTLGPSLLVVSNSGFGTIQSTDTGANDGLVNRGTIQVATSGGLIEISANQFTNLGHLLVSNGGTLGVLSGPYATAPGEVGSSSGTITDSAGVLTFGGTFTNTGSITVSGGTLTLGGTFTDAGSVAVNNATVNLGGVFTGLSFLEMLNNATDVVTVTGTYDNIGGTLNVGAGTALGSIDLIAGLPIQGGTIVDTGGGLLYNGGLLDGVTYDGTMTLGAGNYLDVMDGLVVQSGSEDGIINLTGGFSSVDFLNAETINNLVITMGDASLSIDALYDDAGGTLTIGADVIVQETIGVAQIYSFAGATTVNQGDVFVDGGLFEIYGDGGSFINIGTLQVSNGATLAADAFLGSSQFSNTGSINALAGSDLVLEAGWSNSGTISVSGATLQLGSDTTTAWSSVGTITATDATLDLEGVFTTAQLNQLDLSGDTTQIIGVLGNSSAVLSVGGGSALGALVLAGGTIVGGTIADAGGGIVFGNGTLDGVTYQGGLTVGADGSLWLEDGLIAQGASGSGNGTINLTGGASGLFVLDSETLDNATVNMGDSSFATDFIESFILSGAGTLTLGSHLLIQQTTGDAAIFIAAGGSVVNDGQIVSTGGTFHVDYGVFTNAGTISVSGAGTQFNDNIPSFTNAGRMIATSGAGIALQAGWTNTGTISVSGGSVLQLGSDTTTAWGAIGTIIASSATLDLYGVFTTAQLLSLSLSSDSATIDGVLQNTGGTLNIGTGTALTSVTLAAGGVIDGGVIVDAGSSLAGAGGTLDGVTYHGTLAVGAGGLLDVVGGLTLDAFSGSGPGAMALNGGGAMLAVLDSETLDNANIAIGDASGVTDILENAGTGGTTLTLGAHLVLQQTSGSAQIFNAASGDVTTNRGQISVSGGTLDISGGSFSNAGTLSVSGGGLVTFEPGSFGNLVGTTLTGGVYVVNASTFDLPSGTYITTLDADLTLSGASAVVQTVISPGTQTLLDSTLQTIGVSGALRLLSGRSLSSPSGLLDQGLLQLGGGTLSGSSAPTITGTLLGYGAVLGGLTDNGLIEANGGKLTIVNIASGSGRLQIDSTGTLELDTTDALASSFNGTGGILQLDKPTSYTGTIGGFAVGDTIVLGGVTASSASINSGTLSVNLTNGSTLTYAVTGSFTGVAVHTANVGGNTDVTLGSSAPTQITGQLNNQGNTLAVGNGVTYELDGGSVVGGAIADAGGGFLIGFGTLDGVTYEGTVTVGAGGLLDIKDGLTTETYTGGTPGTLTLIGGGSTLAVLDSETLDNATITIGDASGTTDILSNAGASGTTLTLGAHLLLQQTTGSAELLNAGTTDVTIDRGQIATSGGTLTISGGSFTNSGTISVSGGSEVMFASDTLTNFASATLTGGVWVVGAGSTLELPKSDFITTLNADVTLSGTGSLLQAVNSSGVQTTLDSTLRTIGVTGALRLLSGRSLTSPGTLVDQGLLQLGGGTLSGSSPPTITGTLLGYGSVVGALTDNGLVEANGGRLSIVNIATGSGRLQIDSTGTLELVTTDALASGFNGAGGTLQLDKPTTYTGTIGGFAVGDTLVLAGVTANSASINSGTLSVGLTTGKTLTYLVTGSFTGLTVNTATVGGNTDVTLSSGGGAVVRAAAAAPVATPIQTSQLSLASAGFLDSSGPLAGHVVALTTPGQTLTATAGIRDIFTGTTSAFDHDVIAGFGGTGTAADMLDITNLAFSHAAGLLAPANGGATLSLSDGTHAASLTLQGSFAAADFTLMRDPHGGTLIVHR